MSYNRTPNTVLAGRGLKQSPSQTGSIPAGVVTVTVDSDIATPDNLGLIQVGGGLGITSTGILSTTGINNVTLTSMDYNVLLKDSYIGATSKNITITLPPGIIGKMYYIKNQSDGNIKILASNGQNLDSSSFKTLGSESAIICVFDDTRWNII